MKIQVLGILIGRDFCSIDRNVEGNNAGISARLDWYLILGQSIEKEHSIDRELIDRKSQSKIFYKIFK